MSSSKQIIIVSLLVIVGLAFTAANECPQYCECTSFSTHNHTKCSSLDGLRQIGKTSTIQSLDCSNIGLTKITNQFDKLTNLTQLDLSSNRLSELPRLNRRIKTLNLSNNRFTSGKLSKIPQYVQHLNLSHNDITYIPLDVKNLSHLKTLELSGNPINCSCDTLNVRNWLQEQHVWTDNSVICLSPLKFKGKPWLQIKQSENCTMNSTTQIDPDDNELEMMGDQPFVDGSGEDKGDIDDLESGFLAVSEGNVKADTVNIEDDDDIDGSGDDLPIEATTKGLEIIEGSGSDVNATLEKYSQDSDTTTEMIDYDDEDENEDDGSGSGGFLPNFDKVPKIDDDNLDDYDDSDSEPTNEPDPLNIFGTGTEAHRNEEIEHPIETVTEDILTQEVAVTLAALPSEGEKLMPVKADSGIEHLPVVPILDDSKTANTHESQGTMILLIILGIALVALLAFLIFKRKKVENRNRRDKDDAEAPKGTELMDMDKKALGKPVAKNGNGNSEFIPLMGSKEDGKLNGGGGLPDMAKKENDLKEAQEPLLKKLNEPESEAEIPATAQNYENEKQKEPVDSERKREPELNNEPTENNNNNKPVSPIPPYKRPNSAQKEPVIHNGYPADEDDDVFSPSAPVSPRPNRYSPVYSPETGRVKIKLTETPKPRTPLLVTRTRSSAGDIILTPQRGTDLQVNQ